MEPVLNQDLFDRIGCDDDPEFLQFPLDSPATPMVLSRED